VEEDTMLNQCSVRRPYRGYGVFVQVAELESTSFNGTERRYTVSWTVNSREGLLATNTIASFPEPVKFLSVDEAVDFGEGRAQTFIDAMASAGKKAVLQN
jgi:hypothetical protein